MAATASLISKVGRSVTLPGFCPFRKRHSRFGMRPVNAITEWSRRSAGDAGAPRLVMPDYRARIERGFVITVEAFDWNCPQHITERYTLEELGAVTAPLRARIAELEAELARRPAPPAE